MIGQLLPPGVACAEALTDVPASTMFPQESALVARAVQKRQCEFATVRHCARQALAELGLPPSPVLPGERNAPQWPSGVVGSMTHCDGYRAAALARTVLLAAIGIDAEPHHPLPEGVPALVVRPEEQQLLGRLAGSGHQVHWDRLLFSAKEAVYKAWYPLAGRWLDFLEASLSIQPDGTFHARLLVPGPVHHGQQLTGFTGRWLVSDGLVLTAVTVPPAVTS